MKEYCSHYEEALKVLEKEPQSADDYVERAGILYSHKFYEAAVEDYRIALEMEPNNDIAWYDLAETLWRELHRADEALPIVEKLGATAGDYQASALVFQGEILAKNDPAAALKCFDKAIKLEPNDPDHHLARLRFYLDTDRLTEAAEAIRETTKKLNQRANGPCSELYELRALLAMKQGRTADAVKELNVAIRFCRSEAKYYRLRSDAHEALGNLEKANADQRKAQEIGERQ